MGESWTRLAPVDFFPGFGCKVLGFRAEGSARYPSKTVLVEMGAF